MNDATLVFREITLKYGDATRPPGPRVSSSKDVTAFLSELLERDVTERFAVVALNAGGAVIGYSIAGQGAVDACPVRAADVYRFAILSGAVAIIVGHGHTSSGDPTPSAEDLTLTKRLEEVGRIVGIRLVDHVVIGAEGQSFSFLDAGLIGVGR